MRSSHRTARERLPVAVVVAVIAGTAVAPHVAHAEALSVTTSDGRVLQVGSVVASGERDGDVCVFADDAEIRLSGTNTNVALLTADDGCDLVVARITNAVSRRAPAPAGARPKYVEDAGTATSRSTGAAGGVAVETALDDLARPRPKWQREVYTVHVAQPVYDAAGVRQYEDWYQVTYVEEWTATDGRVRGLAPVDGACVGGLGGEALGFDPLTEIRNCWYRTVANGYSTVSARGGGWYRQGWRIGGTGVTTDERAMSEYVSAWYLGWDYGCNLGGSLPIGWGSECWARRDS
jgi:hypothetical protein